MATTVLPGEFESGIASGAVAGDRRARGLRRAIAPLMTVRGLPRWLFWTGAAITLLFVVLAIFAPEIAPYGYNQYLAHGIRFPQQAPPSAAHWLGTTVVSEDVYSRVIFGARTSIEVVVLALMFSVVIGVPLGLVSGYFGGWLDRVLVLINDSIFAFPYLLLAIVIAFLLSSSVGGGVLTAAIAITVVYIPQYFRVVRNTVLSVREEPYVEAGRALGARPRTVMRRYVFANVVHSVPVVASLNAADAILTLAALSFLGIGMDPSVAAEWGYDISRGVADAQAGFWWTGLFPGLAVILLVTGLTLVGEGINDTFNPLLRRPNHRRFAMPKDAREATTAAVEMERPVVRVRDLRVRDGPGPGTRRRRGELRDPRTRDARPGRRVRQWQVDPRSRTYRPAACGRHPGRVRRLRRARPREGHPAGNAASSGALDRPCLPGAHDPTRPAHADLGSLRRGPAHPRA